MTVYQEIILEHYRNPNGRGLSALFTHEAVQHNPICGDVVHLRVLITNGRVAEVSHETQGCLISQASASVLTEQVVESSVVGAKEALQQFFELVKEGHRSENLLEDALAFQGLRSYPARISCAMLPWKALEKALGGIE